MTKNGYNIVKLETQIEDLKQHLDSRFTELEKIQERNRTDFDYLYKITNNHADKLSRHSVYVIIGGAIMVILVKLMIDVYKTGVI